MESEATRTISLRFSEADYLKLHDQAASLGLKPAVLARVIVRTTLNAPPEERLRRSRREFTHALKHLNDLVGSGQGAAVDPVEVIHQARRRRGQQLGEVFTIPPSRE